MPPALLIYDAACPVCRRARDWVEARAVPGALRCIPCQSEERARLAPGVSETACMEAMHFVAPSGDIYAGADAVALLLPLLRGPWNYLGAILRIPGATILARPAYRALARRRMTLSALLGWHRCDEANCSIEAEESPQKSKK